MEIINKVLPNINKFKSLNIKDFFEKNIPKFDICTIYIRNKQNLFIVNNFINSLGKIIKYNGTIISERQLLSIYIIGYFSKNVFGNSIKLTKDETDLHNKSIEIINILDTFDIKSIFEICNLIKELNLFKIMFLKWKSNDVQSQIDIYLQLYLRYNKEIEINNSDNKDFMNYLKEIRNKSKNYIIKLSNEGEFNKLIENKKMIETKFDKSVENLVKHYLRNAFWDKFKDDLKEHNPNFYQIKGIIKDIKNYFLKIYKNKNKKIEHFNQILDLEFYDQLITNKVLTIDNICHLCKNILDELKEIDSASTDIINRKYFNNLNKDDKIYNIIETLKFIMIRLEFISDITLQINKSN